MKKSRKRECAICFIQDGQMSRCVRPFKVYQSVWPAVAAERGHGAMHSPVGFRCCGLVCRLGDCDGLALVGTSWNLTHPGGREGWFNPDWPPLVKMDLGGSRALDVERAGGAGGVDEPTVAALRREAGCSVEGRPEGRGSREGE